MARSNNNFLARARRRKELARMDKLSPYDQISELNYIDAIVDPAISTAEAVLALPPPNPSLIIRGTTAKYLQTAISKLAGYRKAPIRKMKALLHQLCKSNTPFPFAPLPPKGIGEEVSDLVLEAHKLEAQLRHPESTELARKALDLLEKTFPITPRPLKRAKNAYIYIQMVNDPTFKPPAEAISQKELAIKLGLYVPPSLFEQMQGFIDMPPAGHA